MGRIREGVDDTKSFSKVPFRPGGKVDPDTVDGVVRTLAQIRNMLNFIYAP